MDPGEKQGFGLEGAGDSDQKGIHRQPRGRKETHQRGDPKGSPRAKLGVQGVDPLDEWKLVERGLSKNPIRMEAQETGKGQVQKPEGPQGVQTGGEGGRNSDSRGGEQRLPQAFEVDLPDSGKRSRQKGHREVRGKVEGKNQTGSVSRA
jgi:hypothetical protein